MEIKDSDNDNLPTLSGGPDSQTSIELTTRGSAPEAGQQFGHYRILRLLGQGGFGQVWEAEDTDTGRRLALKVLTKVQGLSVEVLERFKREGQIAATINHPNCVYVFGAEEIDGYPVISMELMPGGTLHDRLKSKERLPVAEAVDRILEVIEGLEAAHRAGVLHRDVKPSNCFLDEAGRAKVGDFGLSRTLERDSTLTVEGSFLGTPSYASPEQVRGRDLDVRTDMYSVGATLYALLTGKPPFEAPQVGEVLARIVSEPPNSFAQHGARLPRGLEHIILRTMAKDRGKRHSSYEALRSDLLPYSSSGLGPVTMARRFGAFALDYLLLYPIHLMTSPLGLKAFQDSGATGFLGAMLLPQLTWFLYFFISEKCLGRSVGKWLLGLKVVADKGGSLSFAQTLVRTVVFLAFFSFIPSGIGWVELQSGVLTGLMALLAVPAIYASYAVLFVSARRRNGYAGLHELASRTRVRLIHRRERLVAPEISLPEAALPVSLPQAFGPYRSQALVWQTETEALVAARDEVLQRDVWVHCYADSAGAPTMASLAEGRPGKLRWLHGSRTPGQAWDAFERPSGCSFPDWVRSRGSLAWLEMRQVLLDVATELDAELRSPGCDRVISLEHLWVTRYGQVKVLEFPAALSETGQGHAIREEGWKDLLHQIVILGLEGQFVPAASLDTRVPAVPLPEHARSFLETLCAGGAQKLLPAAVAADLRNLMGRTAQITRGRRLGPGLVVASIPAVGGITMLILPLIIARIPEDLRDLVQLPVHARSLKELEKLPDSPEVRLKSGAIRTILAAAYLKCKASPQYERSLLALEQDQEFRKVVEAAVKAYPSPSEAEVARARQVVGKETDRIISGISKGVASSFAMVLGVLSIPAVILSVFLRGGLLLRLFGMAVRTRDGRRAARSRCALRALASWGPFVPYMPLPGLLFGASLLDKPVLALLPLAIGAVGLIVIAFRPARSIPDLIAGTVLVPR